MPREETGIVQSGFVVSDLDQALRHWIDVLRVGPFFRVDHLRLAHYKLNDTSSNIDLSVAFANVGEMQIELIFQHNGAPSTYREHLLTRGPGLHHVCRRTSDFAAGCARAQKAGLQLDSEGQILGGASFAYFKGQCHDGPLLEIASVSPAGAAMHALIREASIDWDGSDAVRPLQVGSYKHISTTASK